MDQAFRPALTKKILPRLGRKWTRETDEFLVVSCVLGHRRKGRNYRWKLRKMRKLMEFLCKLPFWSILIGWSMFLATDLRHSQSIVTHLPSIYTRLSILGPHVPSILDDLGARMAAAYWETAVVSLKNPPQHDASHVLCENECKSVTYHIYIYYTLDYVLPLYIYIQLYTYYNVITYVFINAFKWRWLCCRPLSCYHSAVQKWVDSCRSVQALCGFWTNTSTSLNHT